VTLSRQSAGDDSVAIARFAKKSGKEGGTPVKRWKPWRKTPHLGASHPIFK